MCDTMIVDEERPLPMEANKDIKIRMLQQDLEREEKKEEWLEGIVKSLRQENDRLKLENRKNKAEKEEYAAGWSNLVATLNNLKFMEEHVKWLKNMAKK